MTRGIIYGMVTVKSTSNYTLQALQSFFKYTKLSANDEFILIDNDGDWIENWNFKSKVEKEQVHVNTEPKNFSANTNFLINLGIEKQKDIVFLSNDVVFTPYWESRLLHDHNTISIPSCNQTVNYGIPASTSIEEFQNMGLINTTAYRFNAAFTHPYECMLMPMYVFKIPYEVLVKVGLFDEGFQCGGEDIDYRIRAIKAGVDIKYCSSFLMHYNGKSTWNGTETQEETQKRNQHYHQHFIQKWGEDVAELCLHTGNPLKIANKYNLHDLLKNEKYNEMILKVVNSEINT